MHNRSLKDLCREHASNQCYSIEHLKRAVHQGGYTIFFSLLPSPTIWGRTQTKNGLYEPFWTVLLEAAKSCHEYVVAARNTVGKIANAKKLQSFIAFANVKENVVRGKYKNTLKFRHFTSCVISVIFSYTLHIYYISYATCVKSEENETGAKTSERRAPVCSKWHSQRIVMHL